MILWDLLILGFMFGIATFTISVLISIVVSAIKWLKEKR